MSMLDPYIRTTWERVAVTSETPQETAEKACGLFSSIPIFDNGGIVSIVGEMGAGKSTYSHGIKNHFFQEARPTYEAKEIGRNQPIFKIWNNAAQNLSLRLIDFVGVSMHSQGIRYRDFVPPSLYSKTFNIIEHADIQTQNESIVVTKIEKEGEERVILNSFFNPSYFSRTAIGRLRF